MNTLASQKNNQTWLGWFLRGTLLLGSLFLIARLFELQVIKGKYFRALAEGNRIKRIALVAPRGKVLARGGEEIKGTDFAHILGYLGETTESEVGTINSKCPEKGARKLGQMVGRTGLHKYYECSLSGLDGEELWEVDSMGEKLRFLGKRDPLPGNDLHTNIDFSLQSEIAKSMTGKSGSVIATDKNGEILALYSNPSFDPDNIARSLESADLPLFNRAIGGLYHPGSVFKPLVAIAALEQGKIDKNYKYNDTGVLTVESQYGNFSYSNWYYTQYGGREGEIEVTRALARSTDTFFYKIGELTGIEALLDWVKKFGLTQSTEIDIEGEIISLIPSPEWKEKVKKERWFLGNTYHFSIGQGDLAVTPIGLHRANLVVFSDGNLCDLKLAGDTRCTKINIKKLNLDLIKEGMVKACSEGGTGFTFFDFAAKHNGITVACKTGTAETNEDEKTHAWFTANARDLMITVMVEKSGEGSKVAGPIARQIFDYYFSGEATATASAQPLASPIQ
jgi:penicillin-binding protein 2